MHSVRGGVKSRGTAGPLERVNILDWLEHAGQAMKYLTSKYKVVSVIHVLAELV